MQVCHSWERSGLPRCCCCRCCRCRFVVVVVAECTRTFPLIRALEYRVRHKKCDETRPSCINCSSTGRKCDGFPEVQLPRVNGSGETQSSEGLENTKDLALRSHVGLRPIAMVDPGKIGLSTHECFFLDFFRNVGAAEFVGYPTNNFLYRVVRQIGESQPSVKHAAMALIAANQTH